MFPVHRGVVSENTQVCDTGGCVLGLGHPQQHLNLCWHFLTRGFGCAVGAARLGMATVPKPSHSPFMCLLSLLDWENHKK